MYVHLVRDGGIFIISVATGKPAWITQLRLLDELRRAKAGGGMLLYSRDDPDVEPPPIVLETFERIVDLHLPMKLQPKPHPAIAGEFRDEATTLMLVSHAGETDLVWDLVERGADLEARDADGLTALMYAANMGREAVVALLLEAGADVNATDKQNSTPVMFAAQYGHLGTVEQLIAAGADLTARGDHGFTALGFSLQNGHRKTRRLLKEAGAIV